MRRATITLTDELEALVDDYLGRLETPPSLTVLLQAALRSYFAGRRAEVGTTRSSEIGEAQRSYDADAAAGRAILLDPETELALRRAAAEEGMATEELAALVLRRYASGLGRPRPRGAGQYRSGRTDVSSRAEELLRSGARKRRR